MKMTLSRSSIHDPSARAAIVACGTLGLSWKTSCVNLPAEKWVGGGGGRSPHLDRGHVPRAPLATPSRRWRAAQTARVEARPAGPAGAKRHAPTAPDPAVRLRQLTSTAQEAACGPALLVVQAQAPSAKKLLRGSQSSCFRVFVLGVGSEGAGGDPPRGGVVDHGPRHGGDDDGDVALQGAVTSRVIRKAILPAAPHDPAPGTPERAQRAGVVLPAGEGTGVEVLRPGVVVAGAVRQRVKRLAQALVAPPAETGGLALAGLDRHGGLAGVAGERVARRVACAAVADLGQQLGGSDHAVGAFEQRAEDLAVGVLADRRRDPALELLDLPADQFDHRDQRQHQLAAGAQFKLADATVGSAPELCQQLGRLLAAGVVLAREKPGQARLAEPARVGGAGVALKKRERDLAVQIAKQAQRSGPEALKLGPQLVAKRGPRADEILPPAGQRPQRLRRIRVRLEHPEAVIVGARQLAQHERVNRSDLPPDTRNRSRAAAT